MQEERPEIVHNYETAAHDAFLRSLAYCTQQAGSYEGPFFTQCIKAAGINFATAYEQFLDVKVRHQQATNSGIVD